MSQYTKKKLGDSEYVKKALAEYNEYKNSEKFDGYTFSDSDLLKQTEDKYFNAKDFSYSPSNDALYTHYKNTYQAQGKKAMEDSIGNASFLTGGYSNSYAQGVGQSTYNEHLQKMNDVLPELYSQAYEKYSSELDRLENKLNYLSSKDQNEYDRYSDSYNAYKDELDSLRQMYLENAELEYKYSALDQDRLQFNNELAYKSWVSQEEIRAKNAELRLQKQELLSNSSQEDKEYIREDEIYMFVGKGDYYEALSALDYNYDDDDLVRLKALAMGIDKDYIESYFEAKN